ncbi:MBL fold metallo-hydrolase [Cellulomonas sp. WB94]|uniref:MBL fold metallo-hydrolase n=1 Tax=Cellulomonas sp. WB94 TaxID=2173174 RepID=UPI001304F19A|nr:MBL fold metallo-hydrolase [Cellulomonas sp. WB94]
MGRELTQVAPGVWTATAEIWTSLTTLVVADDGACLVVDPGITVAEVECLADEIRDRGWHVEAAFATHAHWDHVLWSARLGDVPRWATPAAAAAQQRSRDADLAKADAAAPGHDRELFGRITALPDDAVAVPWSGPRALVVGHHAHAPGHAALVLPDSGVLVAGDMLSDIEIPLLDVDAADPVGDYRDGLHRLEAAVTQHAITAVVPGTVMSAARASWPGGSWSTGCTSAPSSRASTRRTLAWPIRGSARRTRSSSERSPRTDGPAVAAGLRSFHGTCREPAVRRLR